MITNRGALCPVELSSADRARRELALELVEAALSAIEPRAATRRALAELRRAGERFANCHLLAFGKAARGMAEAALAELEVRDGMVLGFESGSLGPLRLIAGAHPLPAPDAAERGREVLDWCRGLSSSDCLLCLVSGGGSSLLELPLPGLSLDDLSRTARLMMHAGADILELNAVRSQLSQLKAGGLLEATPARVVNVVISDVPGHGPELVASGPTYAPGFQPDPRACVERLGLSGHLPAAVEARLTRPAPRASSRVPLRSLVAADNLSCRRAVVAHANALGLPAEDLPGYLSGEARAAGPQLLARARAARRDDPDLACVVWGGETSVVVRGAGRGGRNQELCLGALPGLKNELLLSVGSDGIDGQSEAAGALLDAASRQRAAELELDPARALRDNDSAGFFCRLGTQIVTGPTGSNVADLALVLFD